MIKIIIGKSGAGKSTRVISELKTIDKSLKMNMLLVVEDTEVDKYKTHLKDANKTTFVKYHDNFPKGDFDTMVFDSFKPIENIEKNIDLKRVSNLFITAQDKADVKDFIGVLLENNKNFTVEPL